jgi:hypothetical protein
MTIITLILCAISLTSDYTHKYLITLYQSWLLLGQVFNCVYDFLPRFVLELLVRRTENFSKDFDELWCK